MSDAISNQTVSLPPAPIVMLARARSTWASIPAKTRKRLILAFTVIGAIAALVAWWGTRTDWKSLYSGLEGRDLQQVENELAAASISYQSTPDGNGVMVPAELLDKARMEVATKGVPQSGRMGFELFDKPNWVGSEFDEKVNYQRALEGELEHTIATIGDVRSARVHLALPQQSLFTDNQQKAKASVVLKLRRNSLGREEIDSIRNLVAGAVDGLTPDQVTLVDADGRINLNKPGQSVATSEEEQQLADKVVAMLEPLAGRENVRATVNISYDQSSREKTDEVVDPSQVVAVQQQKSTQSTGGAARPAGIPGTASNTPSVGADGKAQLPVFPTQAQQGGSAQEESATFAVTKHTVHEEQGPGRVARVTAAILINDRATVEGQGKSAHTMWRPRTIDEMKRLEELAQAAVGFSKERGDSVVLQNIGFSANVPEAVPTGMQKFSDGAQSLLQQQPGLLRVLGFVGVASLLIVFVARPAVKTTMAVVDELRALPAPLAHPASLPSAEVPSALELAASNEPQRDPLMRRGAIDTEGVLEYVAAHVRKDPKQSTRLLESWIHEKERRA